MNFQDIGEESCVYCGLPEPECVCKLDVFKAANPIMRELLVATGWIEHKELEAVKNSLAPNCDAV